MFMIDSYMLENPKLLPKVVFKYTTAAATPKDAWNNLEDNKAFRQPRVQN
jgi:hypothetical protein